MNKEIIAIIIGFIFLLAGFFFAQDMSLQGDLSKKLESYKGTIQTTAGGKTEIAHGDFFSDFLPKVIKMSIQVFGSVMLIMIVISGIYLVAGGLDENLISTAKTMFYYSLIGAVIVTISFSIVYGITTIDWT